MLHFSDSGGHFGAQCGDVGDFESHCGDFGCHFGDFGGLLIASGINFESFWVPFWCPFEARAKKWKMQWRLGENPPDGALEGHFFNIFSPAMPDYSKNEALRHFFVILPPFWIHGGSASAFFLPWKASQSEKVKNATAPRREPT